jgi:exosome complex component MTR3
VSERDLGVHLETALRGVIIADRWPKSGLDVSVTIIEGEDDRWWGDNTAAGPLGGVDGWGLMNVLAGCITVASAALADARIDCLDLIAGGVAGFVESKGDSKDEMHTALVLDPNPAEHQSISSLCLVGYMPSRDEITELWLKGDIPTGLPGSQSTGHERLVDGAIEAARAVQTVLVEAVKESAQRFARRPETNHLAGDDVDMTL